MSLLDQYGRSLTPGKGGGYVKVYDNGYGKRIYRDCDPATGIKRELIFHGDGTMTNRVTQMLSPLKKYADTVKETHQKHKKRTGGYEQQAVISMVDYFNILKRCGWKPGSSLTEFDRTKFDRIANDSNEAVMKTRPGRISSKRSVWY